MTIDPPDTKDAEKFIDKVVSDYFAEKEAEENEREKPISGNDARNSNSDGELSEAKKRK